METKNIIAKRLNQTIASTSIDSQGEKIPKEILEDLCQANCMPLQQNHTPEKRVVGYVNNLHLIPDSKQPGEWVVKGDVFFTEKSEVSIDVGGFSWSRTKVNEKYQAKDCLYSLYLPHPYYNNKALLDSLMESDKKLSLGYWYKKSADPSKISLLVSFTLFSLSPFYKKFFDEVLWPNIEMILSKISDIKKQGMDRIDFIQIVDINGEKVNIYFIPGVGAAEKVCFQKDKINNAFEAVCRYMEKDDAMKALGYSTIKLWWDLNKQEYFIYCVEFRNGQVKYIKE